MLGGSNQADVWICFQCLVHKQRWGLKCPTAQVVAVDLSFTLFERVWCIAELAEAKQLRLQQLLGQWIESLVCCFFVLLFAGCLSCSFVVVVVVVVVAAKGKTRSTAVL